MTVCTETSAASWLVDGRVPWQQLVRFGPAGLPAHARLRFLPDPTAPGQHESDASARPGALGESEQLRAVLAVLARRTSTPGRCYSCLWDGWGLHPVPPVRGAALVRIPHRAYHLFQGAWSDVGDWGALQHEDGSPGWAPQPAFVWPADRAWCIARDVDPHWAGIGADPAALRELAADPRLDVVPADPRREPPAYL